MNPEIQRRFLASRAKIAPMGMRLIAAVLLASAVACAQSDDVAAAARANKQNQPGQSTTKIYTNDDLGWGNPKENEKKAAKKEEPKKPLPKPDRSKQIIQQIHQQREQITRLSDHLDKLKKLQAERSALETPQAMTPELCTSQPERCESRGAFFNDIRNTQRQLDATKKKLSDIQEQARKDGYPDSVVDPD